MVNLEAEVDSTLLPVEARRPRVNGVVLLGVAITMVVASFAIWLTRGVHIATPKPGVVEQGPRDVATWTLEYFGWALWLVVWAGGIRSVIVHKKLTPWVLCLIASQSMWWQEWYADWGGYLQYSKGFHLMPWGSTVFASPNKPWVLVAVYGWYFQLMPYMLKKINWIRDRYPKLPRTTSLIVIGGVLFYSENLVFEGIGATRLGWWSYVQHVGPAFHWHNGTWPLFGPVIPFTLFGIAVIWMLDKKDRQGRLKLDVLSGAMSVREGWRRESARAVVWVLTFNSMYIITLLVPLILIRTALGRGSFLVP